MLEMTGLCKRDSPLAGTSDVDERGLQQAALHGLNARAIVLDHPIKRKQRTTQGIGANCGA
jgi:hypothetical protein